jgi:hypothetical protein
MDGAVYLSYTLGHRIEDSQQIGLPFIRFRYLTLSGRAFKVWEKRYIAIYQGNDIFV